MMLKNNLLDYNSLLKTFFISVAAALFAFIVVFFFTNYSSLYFAYDFDIPAFFNFEGISFFESNSELQWSRDAMITILLSKPISGVIGGIIFLFILMLATKKPMSIIILLFWLNVFAFNSAFGVLIDDLVARAGTYEIAVAMNVDITYLLVTGIVFIFIFLKIGMMNGRLILLSFPKQNLYSIKPRIFFFIIVFLIPWSLVVAFMCFTGCTMFSVSGAIKNLPAIVLLIPFLTAKKPENLKFEYLPAERFLKIDLIFTILFILISIMLMVVISNGITISG